MCPSSENAYTHICVHLCFLNRYIFIVDTCFCINYIHTLSFTKIERKDDISMCLLTYLSISLSYFLPASHWTISPPWPPPCVSHFGDHRSGLRAHILHYSPLSPFPAAPTLFGDHTRHWGYQEGKGHVFHGAYDPGGETR